MPKLQSVRIRRFKCIEDADFNLSDLNILIGANNSGKSSIIQGIHFAIGILQTISLAGTRQGATSLSPAQLLYTPSDYVYSLGDNGRLTEDKDRAITVEFVLSDGDRCQVQVRKGRNRNINVAIDNTNVASTLSNLETPFTIFSPGLAGISRREQYVSDGVLLRTLARGDANLVLRNILLRLWDTPEWQRFLDDLHEVFPSSNLRVKFEKSTDEVITVDVKVDQDWVPIELAGTGLLQATQILSYIHRFGPSVIVLDEPDSHLHPNNQRLLCALLERISATRATQVILTTHSRHVVDALGSGSSTFLWVRDATVDVAGPDDEIGILLDIGALDVKERVGDSSTKIVVLTEDGITHLLETILKASGFDDSTTTILSYHGATSIKNLRPLVNMIRSANPNATIVLHRDRDFLSSDEIETWKKNVRQLRVEPFLTDGTDIESHFVNPYHLSFLNPNCDANSFEKLIGSVSAENRDALVEAYVNGHVEAARRGGCVGKLNYGELATQAPKDLENDPERFRHGKSMLRLLRDRFRTEFGENLQVSRVSEHIANDVLKSISQRAIGGSREN